ncbi:histone-lysine N-methyltransferase, H3 lysine-9 specific SUVH4 isoform X2 [Helianthus annuus]|uniref:histone-lysine N-methyltransferase, H3 lysine-9 specific SUVH4 isoform X2 n=1 Tax=Helianthus annuus TaxID=4232 RepID=UPI000B900022|nr:histone-lysine N-methyltransferase, H3 lysine-9 specific SUVH4 isoform X2 [Helianthus annuus]
MESLGNGTLDVSVTKKFGQRVQKKESEEKKRCSPRLREIHESKRPYYGPPRKHHPPILLEGLDAAAETPSAQLSAFSYVPHTRTDKARVKKALRIYNKYYLHFFQEEYACENDTIPLAKHLDLKQKEGVCEIGGKRPDLKAISKMIECNEVLFPTKRFGHLPGIDVGYQFYSRAEMVALGLHSHWLNSIDYMGVSCKITNNNLYHYLLVQEEFKGYTFPIAIAIVLSGEYEDNSEDIVYTGEDGNRFTGSEHQEMSCGNLALKNSMKQSIPVRVIRGHAGDNHLKIYTYDGLYKVSECWPAEGVSGFVVYKYLLKRLEGQPKLTSNQVECSNGRSRVPAKAPLMVCLDISEGQEDVHIPVVNTIDDTTITGFTYTKYNQILSNLKLPPNADGCDCKGSCKNPKRCSCARLNGVDFPYVRSNGGRLIEAKDVVFECGPNCGCGPGCINRISQQGIKYQLEVFRTSDRGWAVKTKDFIPSGAPVCEYIGELRRTNELDSVAENDYIFEIDCWQTIKGIGGRERRLGDVFDLGRRDEKEFAEPEFCVDAGRIGNVARFINHSCDPNLFVQCVLSSHHDLKLARIVLFASDDIAPMQELTYDYGYALDSVVDKNGKVRMLPCHCGTSECRKRLY